MSYCICPRGFGEIIGDTKQTYDVKIGDIIFSFKKEDVRIVEEEMLASFRNLDLTKVFDKSRIELIQNINHIKILSYSSRYNQIIVKYEIKVTGSHYYISINTMNLYDYSFSTLIELEVLFKAYLELSNQAIILESVPSHNVDNNLKYKLRDLFSSEDDLSVSQFITALKKLKDFDLIKDFINVKINYYDNEHYMEKLQALVCMDKFKEDIEEALNKLNKKSNKYQELNNYFTGKNPASRYLRPLVNGDYYNAFNEFVKIDLSYVGRLYFLAHILENLDVNDIIEILLTVPKFEIIDLSSNIFSVLPIKKVKPVIEALNENNLIFNVPIELIDYKNDVKYDYFKYAVLEGYSVKRVHAILKNIAEKIQDIDLELLRLFLFKAKKISTIALDKLIKTVERRYNIHELKYDDIYIDTLHYNRPYGNNYSLDAIRSYDDYYDDFMNKLSIFSKKEVSHVGYKITHFVYLHNVFMFRLIMTNDNLNISFNVIDGSLRDKVAKQTFRYIMLNNINGVNDFISNSDQEIKRLEALKQNKEYIDLFNDFASNYDNKKVTELKKELVNIDVYLDQKINQDKYAIKLKIGTTKTYILKSLDKLAQDISNNNLVTYGKGLEFYASYDSFNEHSKKLLSYLIDNKCYQELRTFYSVSNDVLFNIINIYKGQNIYYDDKPYFVSLDKEELNFTVDDNYIFSVNDYNENNTYLTINNNKTLVFLNNLRMINYIDDNNGLFNLAMKLNNKSIEPVKEEFFKNIYTRIPNRITLDDIVKLDYREPNLEVKLYFDYSNHISVKKEYLIDYKLTNYNDLDYLSKQKVDNINNILYKLGFVDDKIIDVNKLCEFFMLDFSELRKLASVYLSDSISKLNVEKFKKPILNFKTRENSLANVFLDDLKYSEEELEQIFKALKKKTKYTKLNNDRLIFFDDSDALFYDGCAELGLSYDKEVTTPLYNIIKYSFDNKVKFDKYIKDMLYDFNNYKNSEFELPEINATMRDYQIDGFKWLKTLEKYSFGGILADEMGLGKTLQVIALLVASSSNKPNLIVCPKSLVYNWVNEYKKFAPNVKVIPIIGNKEERLAIENNLKDNCTYITSYETVRIDGLEEHEFNYCILDEAQAIKNHTALKSQSIRNIRALHRLCLTGTPIENSIEDMWSIFLFLMPGFFKSLNQFNKEYEKNSKDLHFKVSPFILRRTKKEVLTDLPDKYEEIITCDISKEERKLYESFRNEARKYLDTKDALFNILKYLTRLRQICVSPSLFVSDYTGMNSKLDLLFYILKECKDNGNRVLLFSQFVSSFDLICPKLKELGINYNMITGSTSAKDRIEIANDFNATSHTDLLLISLKAGGTGLNLTSADTVIHLDPWWNAAVENQATDRAHRIGQTKNVRVIKLVCEDTIEQRVIDLQNEKKSLFKDIIDNEDNEITKLSEDDIKYILG